MPEKNGKFNLSKQIASKTLERKWKQNLNLISNFNKESAVGNLFILLTL